MRRKYLLGTLAGCVLAQPILTGCSGQAQPMNKQDQANFKGSPMPADRRAAFFSSMHPNKQPNAPNGQAAPNAKSPAANSDAQSGH